MKLQLSARVHFYTDTSGMSHVVRLQIQQMIHEEPHGEDKRQQEHVVPGEASSQYKKFCYSENSCSLEQPPLVCSRVSIAGDFQDAIGLGGRYLI